MQTLTLDIHDNFMQDFQNIIDKYKDKIIIKKDKNLEYDPENFQSKQTKRYNKT